METTGGAGYSDAVNRGLLKQALAPLGQDLDLRSLQSDTFEGQLQQLRTQLETEGVQVARRNLSLREIPKRIDITQKLLAPLTGDAGTPYFLWIEQVRKDRFIVTLVDENGTQTFKRSTSALFKQLESLADNIPLTWYAFRPVRPFENMRSHGPKTLSPLQRIRALVHSEHITIQTVAIYAFAVGILNLATPLAVQSLVNTVAFGTLLQPLLVLTTLLFAGLAFAGTLRILEIIVIEFWQRRFFAQAASDVAYRVPHVDHSYQRQTDLRETVNRFLEVAAVQKTVSILLLDGVGLLLQTVVGMLVLAFYHPILLAFDILLIMALLAIFFFGGRGAVSTACKESKAKFAFVAWLETMATKSYSNHASAYAEPMIARADELTTDYLDARQTHFSKLLRQNIGLVVVQALASAVLLGTGGWLVIQGQLTLGQLVAAELIVTAVIGNVAKFGKHLETFYDTAASMDKIGQLVDLPMSFFADQTSHRKNLSVQAENLNLANEQSEIIIKGANFTWTLDSLIAIDGPQGSGKSLLLSALSDQVPVASGDLEVFNSEGHRWNSTELRHLGSWVDPTLLHGTIDQILSLNARESLGSGTDKPLYEDIGLNDLMVELSLSGNTFVRGFHSNSSYALRVILATVVSIQSGCKFLIFDGILDLLDEETVATILSTLRQYKVGALITTHATFIENLCDARFDLHESTLERTE